MNILLINAIDIEGFLYVNFIPVLIVFILLVLIILGYSTYVNFKYNCPKCGAVNDIKRIKKNIFFKKVGISDAYRKYVCGKCHNKFYIYNKNIENTKTT
jgi:DNA-directed RNA polymerase subunit RPC12/RpoP